MVDEHVWFFSATSGISNYCIRYTNATSSLCKEIIQAFLRHSEGSTRLAYSQHCLVGHRSKMFIENLLPTSNNKQDLLFCDWIEDGKGNDNTFLILWHLTKGKQRSKYNFQYFC